MNTLPFTISAHFIARKGQTWRSKVPVGFEGVGAIRVVESETDELIVCVRENNGDGGLLSNEKYRYGRKWFEKNFERVFPES